MTLLDGRIDGSLADRPGAVASSAGAHHVEAPRSIRFVPDASPGSTGAWRPMSNDARNELTRWIRSVAAYADGSRLQNFLIWGPVKRSNAREPVFIARSAAPPTASVISAHSAGVLESSQIGDTFLERTGATCSCSGRSGAAPASAVSAPAARYTLPCCWAEPEMAARRDRFKPPAATRASITSSASVQSSGEEQAMAGFASGRTPCLVPYCGRSLSKDSDD